MSPVAEGVLELPASAPQIRVTAGVGSAGQKTWNLRRPVTLLGSKRPAHIVLHDHGVSAAHCAIINTGTDVLLFDLHTSGGSFRGKEPVELVALQDGDVITLGESIIQVAIRVPAVGPNDSGSGIEYNNPLTLINPVTFTLVHTETRWTIEQAVALIGRNDGSAIRLDHDDVSARHALLFRFGRDAAIFDLGSRAGVWVNGQRRDLTLLTDGDRVTIGSFGLHLQVHDRTVVLGSIRTAKAGQGLCSTLSVPMSPELDAVIPAPSPLTAPTSGSSVACNEPLAPAGSVGLQAPIDPLETNIAEAWEKLNQWRAQLRHDAAAITEQQTSLSERESQLEARDAALRGQLHDISRFNEQLAEREKELAITAAQVQAQMDAMTAAQKDFLDKQIEQQKKEEELHRREQALAQRWSRMQSTVCPHCQKPIALSAS